MIVPFEFRMTLNNEAKTGGVPEVPDIARELREAGLKATPQRVAIVASLTGDQTHPTAQEIYDRLRPDFPGMAFATVYNTLSALMRVGRLTSLSLGGAARFDPNVGMHDHAICDRCGKVRDVASAGSPKAGARELATQPLDGFTIQRVERIYRGTCGECRSADDA